MKKWIFEAVAKLGRPEKSMILAPVIRDCRAVSYPDDEATPGGGSLRRDNNPRQKGDFNGRPSFAIGSFILFLVITLEGQGEMPPFYAEKLGRTCNKRSLYFKLEGGGSLPEKALIHAPAEFWDVAPQGYDGDLTSTGYGLVAVGYELSRLLSGELSFSYRPNYHYQKFQTSTASSTPGFIGTKTRRFDLDIGTLMFTTYLLGQAFPELTWAMGRSCLIYPFVGGGVGVNRWNIYNFRSTGLPSVVPPAPSFSSENQYHITYSFSYEAVAGLEFRYGDQWALSLGYRWFSADKFHGPRYLRGTTGSAVDALGNTWKIQFSANEAFLALKVFL